MNRTEWLEWRRQGLGSSDYAVIMGVSPWMNLQQLYESKINPPSDIPPNFAMERGIRMEPRIRSLYELIAGETFDPALLVMDGFEFMRVSLDGLSHDVKTTLEIKYCNKSDWETVNAGRVPAKYMPQAQGQLLVSGAEACAFVAYPFTKEDPKTLDPKLLAVAMIYPDKNYQADLFKKCHEFWYKHVLPKIPPVKNEIGIEKLIGAWKNLNAQLKEIEGCVSEIRSEIIKRVEGAGLEKTECDGVKIIRVSRVGNVQYKNIPELKGVDLEKYRGKGSVLWQMKVASA